MSVNMKKYHDAAMAFIEACGLTTTEVIGFRMEAGSAPVFEVLDRDADWSNGPVTKEALPA